MKYRFRRKTRGLEALGFYNIINRDKIVEWRWIGLPSFLCVCFICVHLASYNFFFFVEENGYSLISGAGSGRHLLATNGSSESHGPEWERCDFENANVPGVWVFSHALCVLIIFIALAIICDDFFVPSLEIISEKLSLSEDVAGATFMAAGSSAPELFSSVAGVANETDVGVGTIVGSAVFNLLIIIALTAALAGQILHLDWRPLMRDAFFYTMSLICFIGFAWDGYFMHYEAIVLLVLYALYIVLMVFNPRIMDWLATWNCCCDIKVEPHDDVEKEADKSKDEEAPAETPGRTGSPAVALQNGVQKKPPLSNVEEKKEEKDEAEEKKEDEKEDEEEEATMSLCPCLPCCPLVRTHPPSAEEAKTTGGAWNWFKLIVKWILFIPAFPFVVLFSWTVPDCSKEHLKKWYIVSFVMAVFWIAALSFGMVTLTGRIGCILNIDTYIMGLVIIAIGTSIPDTLSSILVARDGYGDMAVSNAIGSNVFDINLGLGLPFLIRIAIDVGDPINLLDDEEWSDYLTGDMVITPHAKFGFILCLILFLALAVFSAAKFRLNKYIGISFVTMYVLFLSYAFIQELYCVRTRHTYC